MVIYFAITKSMFDKYGMTEDCVRPGVFIWTLGSDKIGLAANFTDNAGDVLNSISEIKEPIAICEGVMDDKLARQAINCAFLGDNPGRMKVTVYKIIWVSNSIIEK